MDIFDENPRKFGPFSRICSRSTTYWTGSKSLLFGQALRAEAPMNLTLEGKGRIKAIIFDLDGVLTDTSELHYQSWKILARRENIPFTRTDNEQLRGISRRQSLELLLGGRNAGEAQMAEMMHFKNECYKEMLRQLSPASLLPGAENLMDEAQEAGIRIGIASGSKNALDVVNRLGIKEKLAIVADGYSVGKSKPAPDLFLYTAEQLQTKPTYCAVFEDAASGIEAALKAGMSAIGIGPPERVGRAHAVFPNLEGISLRDIVRVCP